MRSRACPRRPNLRKLAEIKKQLGDTVASMCFISADTINVGPNYKQKARIISDRHLNTAQNATLRGDTVDLLVHRLTKA